MCKNKCQHATPIADHYFDIDKVRLGALVRVVDKLMKKNKAFIS
jgi:hypothetical protein